jgi:predicted Zn finger-like uncharacterized protein
MIAACPTCGARYRIEVSKLRPEGAKLRCTRCEAVFRVRGPAETAAPARPAAPAVPAAVPVVERPAPAPRSAPVSAPPPVEMAEPEPVAAGDSSRLVLVAHPEVAAGKAAASALTSWGYEALLVHDGVEAILAVQRSLPRAVVLDAALPKMFGFQVCEVIKRNESLRHIHVVLVGAIHDQSRYRRPPNEIYGADAYVERQELPDALSGILDRLGMPAPGGPPPSREGVARPAPRIVPIAPPPAPAPAARPAAPAAAPARQRPAPGGDGLDDVRAQAERLARIIVSDIVLYNAEKFDAGVRAGDVVGALDAELEEGRALFAARIDPRVGSADEFLQRELLRVARSRETSG